MRMGALHDRRDGRCVVARVWKPAGAWARMRGLLGRPPLGAGEGMLLEPCGAVHTFGMRYALDLVFLDRGGRVAKLARGVGPWRVAGSGSAHATLELADGAAAACGLKVGDVIDWRESDR
ncbi:MAG: hypothetical protein A3I02_14760 [Betaproteobacteria bacterium RIFCSPLOWO2_02_FULL_67_26]|nr:MAG: hypothetical protein A3I02_14760 [Betaproteobacteria bacterium RIFCSPLOWO2_02_FULL_67_26]